MSPSIIFLERERKSILIDSISTYDILTGISTLEFMSKHSGEHSRKSNTRTALRREVRTFLRECMLSLYQTQRAGEACM